MRNIEYAEHIYVEHRAPLFGIPFSYGAVETQPGIVDEDIQSAEVLCRAVHERGAVCGVRDIRGNGEGFLTEFLSKLYQPVFAAGGQNDVAAALRELWLRRCR